MDHLKEIAERRMQASLEAAARWNKSAPERAELQKKLTIGGPRLANPAARVAQFTQRESVRATRAVTGPADLVRVVEAQIGGWDATELAPDEAARTAGKPVARIVTLPERNYQPQGFATGFLISDRLLLTNHHVFSSAQEAAGTGVNFLYERTSRGVQNGILFELDPQAFFYTFEPLDMTLVAVKPVGLTGEKLSDLGYVRPIAALGKILIGQAMNIIGYPSGGVKQYATRRNKVTDIRDNGFLYYSTDTLPGNSGSAGYNKDWELVALHHAGIPQIKNGKVWSRFDKPYDKATMQEDDIVWVANEGARTSAVVERLRTLQLNDPAARVLLDAALAASADPLRPEAAPVPVPISLNAPNPTAMNQIIFNLNGPVTINIGTAPAAPAVPAALPLVAADVEEAAIKFDPAYGRRKGYDPKFLNGFLVPLPTVIDKRQKELLKDDNDQVLVLKYHHFSLAMNADRRLQMWSAVNVDYSPGMKGGGRKSYGTDRWIPDPRIPIADQVTDADLYGPATKVDRGHIVRREDNAWGSSDQECEYANSDTFHWTNCTPQHEAFNRSNEQGLWGLFENAVTDQIGAADNRACILAGPVLAKDDPMADFGTGAVKYPLRFWKVVVAVSTEVAQPELRAYGFLFDQKEVVKEQGLEEMDFRSFAEYQCSLETITSLSGVEFDKRLLDADVRRNAGRNEKVRITNPTDIVHPKAKQLASTNGKR